MVWTPRLRRSGGAAFHGRRRVSRCRDHSPITRPRWWSSVLESLRSTPRSRRPSAAGSGLRPWTAAGLPVGPQDGVAGNRIETRCCSNPTDCVDAPRCHVPTAASNSWRMLARSDRPSADTARRSWCVSSAASSRITQSILRDILAQNETRSFRTTPVIPGRDGPG